MGPLAPEECTGQTQVYRVAAAKAPVGIEQLNAISWMQTAKEYPAITRAAYRRAIDQLPALATSCTSAADEQPVSPGLCGQGKAIVMDIDETVLDNSAYFATLAVQQQTDAAGMSGRPGCGSRGTGRARCGRIHPGRAQCRVPHRVRFQPRVRHSPGLRRRRPREALPATRGDRRQPRERAEGTRRPCDVYLRYAMYGRMDDEKNERRAQVAAKWRIAMLVGDDLRDFVRSDRYNPQQHDVHWSHDWIVLPNVIYGGWERSRSVAQKYSDLRQWQRK